MTHHPDWASGILGYLRTQFKKKQWTDPETQALRDALHAFAPNPEVQKLIGEMLGSKLPVAHQLFLLDAVEKSEVKKLPAGWIKALGDIVMRTREPEHSRLRVIAVARSHNIDTLDLQLKQVATNKDAPTSLRLAALGALAPRLKIVAPEIIRYLLDLTIADSAVTRGAAARVLGQMNLDEKQILEVAVRAIPKADAITLTPLLSTFTRNQTEATGRSLVTALSGANPKSLNAAQIRQTIDAQSDVVKTSAAPLLAKLAAREKAQAVHLAKLDPLLAGGDVGRGRRVFFGQKAACSACHAIGEEGSRLGPDLTSIGAIRAGRDILEAIVFPSASQVPGYEAFLVLTNAGEAHMGVIARETTDFLTLRVANNVEQRIERAQIKSIQPAPISLMPQGLDKNLSRQELADLLTFLQSQNGERWLQPDRLGIKDIRVRDSGIRE
jgi:putative heme-binding domain-containing protein